MSTYDFEAVFPNATQLNETNAKLEAMNHLLSHQNAAIDIIAADKRAAAIADISTVAELAKNGELLEVMDYGDQIAPAWADGETNYNPAMNLCHESDELLEDGESVHGVFFEWDRVLPFGVPFDEPEAIYAFDGTEVSEAGDVYIGIGSAYSTGWDTSKHIQITLSAVPDADDQLVIDLAKKADTDPTNGRNWYIYAKGSKIAKQSGTTSNGTSGTNLGSTSSAGTAYTNGKVNAPQRAVYGYNRWSQSALRQYLNSDAAADGWWTAKNAWDRPSSVHSTKAGFLNGYSADAIRRFKPIKIVTVACDADSNAEDVTYDRVFLSSLEQMYCEPQFAGKEGAYWEYYKRLLGRTTPAPRSATYARLIKYALTNDTTLSAQYCFRRSANRTDACTVWIVNSSGYVGTNSAYYANRCAPSVFLSE